MEKKKDGHVEEGLVRMVMEKEGLRDRDPAEWISNEVLMYSTEYDIQSFVREDDGR